jgi:hypothetical protein
MSRSPAHVVRRAGDLLYRRAAKLPYLVTRHAPTRLVLGRLADTDPSAHISLVSEHGLVRPSLLAATVALLDARVPGYRELLAARGEAARDRRFAILGLGQGTTAAPLDWSRDYRSGLRFPPRYVFDIDLLDYGRPTDVRVAWELNRLHPLVDLGKAFQVTRDPSFARAFREIVESWIESNPPAFSVAWGCAMEAAIRIASLTTALPFFVGAPELSDVFLRACLRALVEHAGFIERHLEYADVRNNHYLSDLVGLLLAGSFLQGHQRATHWVEFAARELSSELDHQIRPDGTDHEGSIPYHALVTELLLVARIALERLGRPVVALDLSLERLLGFVAATLRPDGRVPDIGDGDNGRILALEPVDDLEARHLLSTGAVLYGRADFKSAAGGLFESTAWLLGPACARTFDALSPQTLPLARAFPLGGVFACGRDGDHLVVDAGDVGLKGRGGHGHNDMLSFELTLDNVRLVVDTGSSSYTSDVAERKRILSTAAHNTVVIDDAEMAPFDDFGFIAVGNTPGRWVAWHAEGGLIEFEAEHYGYLRLDNPATHRRRFELDLDAHVLQVTDTVRGQGRRRLATYFHLVPGATVERAGNDLDIRVQGRVYRLEAAPPGKWGLGTALVYPRYGVPVEAPCAVHSRTAELPSETRFVFRSALAEPRSPW